MIEYIITNVELSWFKKNWIWIVNKIHYRLIYMTTGLEKIPISQGLVTLLHICGGIPTPQLPETLRCVPISSRRAPMSFRRLWSWSSPNIAASISGHQAPILLRWALILPHRVLILHRTASVCVSQCFMTFFKVLLVFYKCFKMCYECFTMINNVLKLLVIHTTIGIGACTLQSLHRRLPITAGIGYNTAEIGNNAARIGNNAVKVIPC